MVELHDTLILDKKARRLSTGELAASVRCARTGLQDYTGSEVGKPGLARVTVYRPETEVMKRDSIASFAGVPVTIEHPREAVTTDNWKQYAVGEAGDEVLRDGEFIRVPILVRDAAAIRAIEDGKRQISMGYSCTLEFVDGVTPEGEPYQAIQRDIKINHLAVVDRARGGEALTVEDERTYNRENRDGINEPARRETSNSGGSHVATKTITFDGLPLEVTDAAEAAITKLQGQIKTLTEDKEKVGTDLADANTTLAARDAEIVTLKKAVEDAKVTPAQLRDQAKAYSLICDKAKALEVTFAEDADADTIMKTVVDAKMGDTAKGYDAKQIAAAFDVLTKDSRAEQVDPVRNALSGGVVNVGDAKAEFEKVRAAQIAGLRDAHKPAPAKAA
jgi:hypothetical protein